MYRLFQEKLWENGTTELQRQRGDNRETTVLKSFSSIHVFCKHFHLHRCNDLIWLKSINVAITLISCRSRSEKIRIVWLTPRSFIRIFWDQELQTCSHNFDKQYPPPSMWLSKKHLLFMLMFGLLSNNHMQLFMIKISTKHYNFHINMSFKN